jgi:type II secretory pathway component PulF
LPAMTKALIAVASGTAAYWYLSPLPWLVIFGPALLAYAILRYWGWIDLDLPGVGRLVRRFHSAQVLDSLGMVALQKRPLAEGVAALAASYPKYDIRRRLAQTEVDIRAGRDWCESLRRHGLLQPADQAILQAAQRVGNLPWALREMAESSRRRLTYRVQALAQAAFPPLVILLGLVVMFIMVALFLPLITLIQRLSV